MIGYFLRLDDACPTMDKAKWERIELLFDKYNIKPIVGIIPDNKDSDFSYKYIDNFWDICLEWQKKGWIIAQHGLNHLYISKECKSEFKTKSYDLQKKILDDGYQILLQKGIIPTCFFAPNHTFDKNTIKAIKDLTNYKYISDGCSLFPYRKDGVMFLPSIFDTPHKILNHGIYTFVYHPNNMTDQDFEYLENFIIKYKKFFEVNVDDIIKKYSKRRKKIYDYFIQLFIFVYRKLRKR